MAKVFWGVLGIIASVAAHGAELYTATRVQGTVSPTDINDNEEIVGGSGLPYYTKPPDVFETFSALAGSIRYPYANVQGINNRGVMAGISLTGASNTGPVRAFVLDRAAAATARDLGSLHGSSGTSAAWAINESNVIVGQSETINGAHAVRFELDGTITDLGTLGGTSSVAYDINDTGEIVGESTNAAGARRAFLIQGGKSMIDLGTLGGAEAYARRINNNGQVVGSAMTVDGAWHAFLWSQGVMTDLGSLGFSSEALGINDKGVVVGKSSTTTTGPLGFVWYPGGPMQKLGALVKLAVGEDLYEAVDINNNGVILVSIFHPTYRTGYGYPAILRPGAASAAIGGDQLQLKVGAPPEFAYDAQVDSTQDLQSWTSGTPTRLQGEQTINIGTFKNGMRFFRLSIKPAAAQ
jgi:probable HAF family extracellular repeat protein